MYLKGACNNVQRKSPVHQNVFQNKSNNSFRRSSEFTFTMNWIEILLYFLLVPQEFFVPNKRKIESRFEPYLLLTPLTPSDNPKMNENPNCNDLNSLACLSSKCVDNHSTCSTPNTFLETPPNFDFDDYHLNQSIEKVI